MLEIKLILPGAAQARRDYPLARADPGQVRRK
jgi:propanediol dehydratase small subunit